MVFRVVARLDVKPPNVVKGIHLEGFRRVGNPQDLALRYYLEGADEIFYQDVVASLYQRNSVDEILRLCVRDVFIPKTVGGGIRQLVDAKRVMRAGADKISINTAAIARPSLITDLASELGSQAVVVTVEVKRHNKRWLVMTDSGREHTGVDLLEWTSSLEGLGAGEVLLTSVDRDGTQRGFDIDLLREVRPVTKLPIVIHGGGLTPEHVIEAATGGADAVALASSLHFGHSSIGQVKHALVLAGIDVRP